MCNVFVLGGKKRYERGVSQFFLCLESDSGIQKRMGKVKKVILWT